MLNVHEKRQIKIYKSGCMSWPRRLFLTETHGFLNGNGELLLQRLQISVWWQIDTVETMFVSVGSMGHQCRVAYHVCALGRFASSPAFSIVNRLGPSLPWRSLNPLTGMRDVPVVNCNRRDFCSPSQERTVFQKF